MADLKLLVADRVIDQAHQVRRTDAELRAHHSVHQVYPARNYIEALATLIAGIYGAGQAQRLRRLVGVFIAGVHSRFCDAMTNQLSQLLVVIGGRLDMSHVRLNWGLCST
ncbi:hypothetical protein D3C73_1168120 [compost metagenome]